MTVSKMNDIFMKFFKISIKVLCFLVLFFVLSCKEVKTNNDVRKETPILEYKNEEWNESSLSEYIVTYFSEAYQIQSSFFKKATVENTDLLREIVHNTNFKNKGEGRRPKKERHNELGYMFKDKGVGENCGFMSTTLFDVYKSFGFKVKRYDVIDGSLKGFLKYRDSHVFVEVYIPSLGKYIVQDPTINNSVYSCTNQERMSFEEIRKSLYSNTLPCFLENKVSRYMIPNEKLSLRQKIGVLEDYYTGTILSLRKFEGVEEVQIKLHDLAIVANEKERVSDLNFFKKLCTTCELDKNTFTENKAIQNFMKCLNTKVLAQGIRTASFDREENGFLIQYTNEKGKNVLYDPINKFYIGKSYFSYAYWDLNNRGYLLARDFKYMVPKKFYSYRTNEVFEF